MGFFSDVADKVKDNVSGMDLVIPGSTNLLNSAKDAWDSFTGKTQQRDANEANIQMAREQMAFQERMSNSAHQRQVADLKAAGLNPVLSGNQGASVPSGASATIAPLPSGTNKFVATAMEAAQFARDQRQANQGIVESQSRADLNSAQAVSTLGGAPFKAAGADLYRFVKDILQRNVQSGLDLWKDRNFLNPFQRRRDEIRYKKGPRKNTFYAAPDDSNTRSDRR